MFIRHVNILNSNSFFLFGARGVGKTSLLDKHFNAKDVLKIDLLDYETLAQIQGNPRLFSETIIGKKKEWIIVDEVQKVPQILDQVHSLIETKKYKFALTGSSARKLKRGSANLLAGRAFVFKLFPLTHLELGEDFDLDSVLSFGSLPKIFDLKTEREKILFLKAYAETYLREEILIEQLIRNLPPFRRFLEISSHQDTGIVSYSSIAKDVLVDPKIISNYYTILEDTLLGFFLEPYHTSFRKRQKKASKFYWFDTGVRRALCGTVDQKVTPKSFEYGSLFESFIVNEINRILTYQEKNFKLSFIRVDENQEVDLIIERSGLPTYLIEIKSSDRVHEDHVVSLKKELKNIKNAVAVVISNDKLEKTIDGVQCLFWRNAFKEIGISDI